MPTTTPKKDEAVVVNRGDLDPSAKTIQVVFPVTTDAKPRALVVHCVDPRFQKAFRNFIEGDEAKGCLGLQQEEYVALVIPGGTSSMSDAMALPKQFKVLKDQFDFILGHFPSIGQVILINHEDCGAYKFLSERIGGAFLRKFGSILERQKFDLAAVAKEIMGLDSFKAKIRVYMAKFANAEHTQVSFQEITL